MNMARNGMCIDLDTMLCHILTLNRRDEIAIIFFIYEICYYICIFSIKFRKIKICAISATYFRFEDDVADEAKYRGIHFNTLSF